MISSVILVITCLSFLESVLCEDLNDLENWSCSKPGLNAHPNECHSFVLCLNTKDGLQVESIYTCPDSFAFSVSEQTCVHQDKVPTCTQNRYGTGDEDDGFSKRGPGMTSCKQPGSFCHNENVLVVCTDTKVPVLVLDCRSLDETPYCDAKSATCSTDIINNVNTKPTNQNTNMNNNINNDNILFNFPFAPMKPSNADQEIQLPQYFPSLPAPVSRMIERIMNAFQLRFGSQPNKKN